VTPHSPPGTAHRLPARSLRADRFYKIGGKKKKKKMVARGGALREACGIFQSWQILHSAAWLRQQAARPPGLHPLTRTRRVKEQPVNAEIEDSPGQSGRSDLLQLLRHTNRASQNRPARLLLPVALATNDGRRSTHGPDLPAPDTISANPALPARGCGLSGLAFASNPESCGAIRYAER